MLFPEKWVGFYEEKDVVMHEHQQLYFGLLIKVTAASTSCKKMFHHPVFIALATYAVCSAEKHCQRSKIRKKKVDVPSRVHSFFPSMSNAGAAPQQAGLMQAAHPIAACSNPWIIFNRYFKGRAFRFSLQLSSNQPRRSISQTKPLQHFG